MRGVRVFVVVTNSVSTQRRGCGGFIIVIPYVLFLLVLLLLLSVLLASMSVVRFRNCRRLAQKPFCARLSKKQFLCHYQKISLKTDIYIS